MEKKPQAKPLKIHKETLRRLTTSELRRVEGAVMPASATDCWTRIGCCVTI